LVGGSGGSGDQSLSPWDYGRNNANVRNAYINKIRSLLGINEEKDILNKKMVDTEL